MQELNQMLTTAGGVIIAGTIGLVFLFGWTLITRLDNYSSRWVQRLFGLLIVVSMCVLSFWIVFIRTRVLRWEDLAHILPPPP